MKPAPELAFYVPPHRLSAPGSRLKDEVKIFGHSRSYLSITFNDTITHLVLRFQELLYWDDRRLNLEKIKEYAKAVEGVVGAGGVGGFIDGTMRPFCHPGEDQQKAAAYTYRCAKT